MAPLIPAGSSALRVLLAAILILSQGAAGAAANQGPGLYDATIIVSGQGEETRSRALHQGLQEVLVKVSGDPSIADDPRLATLSADPDSVLTGYRYNDRLGGVPLHDDRANRLRPYDLTFHFEPTRIDASLRALGREPWPSHRPVIVVFLAVEFNQSRYVLARDGLFGRDQRRSLTHAAHRFGLSTVLPNLSDLAAARLFFATMPETGLAELAVLAERAGGSVPLAGTLIWDAGTLGWVAEWRLAWQGKTHHWAVRGVSFDGAFRTALRGALQILSGHGSPE